MTPKELHDLAHNPNATPEQIRAALRFADNLIADYTEVCGQQKTTGNPHYLIRIGTARRPQLTVTGPLAEVEERLCELLAAYAYMQGMRVGKKDEAATAAIKESYQKGIRDAMMGMWAAVLRVCPDRSEEIRATMNQMAEE